jgi:senataxin
VVAELLERVNTMDFKRIDKGLKRARNLLWKTPDVQRTARTLQQDIPALQALYEALCSSTYHTNKDKLEFPFDEPFKLVQTRKVLKLGDILPAMTRFLFDPDQYRLKFAITAWQGYDRPLTAKEFDWAVEDALSDAIRSVATQGATTADVQLFWKGVLLILDKMDKPLITHSLRGMEVQPDLYHLALLHLSQHDSDDVLELVIRTLRILLQKSPDDFWTAYGAISSTAIAEQIFTSRAFERLLAASHHHEVIDDYEVPYALAWVSPLVKSLPAAQQYDACRSILHHLLERFQDSKVVEKSKLACLQAGLGVLSTTLATFVDSKYKINSSTSFIVVNNILGLVEKHRKIIVSCTGLEQDSTDNRELFRLGMQVVRNALNLSSRSLLEEFKALQSKTDIGQELESHSPPIWQAVLGGLRRDQLEMAKNILMGFAPLTGLDKLKPRDFKDEKGKRQQDPLQKSKIRFNDSFDQVIEVISCVFERLSDFQPTMLRQLCSKQTTAYPLLAGLTPPNQSLYEAAVEVVKNITGKSGRREAISSLLDDSLAMTLASLAWATHRITKQETFAAIPYLVKTSSDVLYSLCDSQDGLLRARGSVNDEEKKAIMYWWTEQWDAMGNTFNNYELWSHLGYTRAIMENHCRDIMEYAETLFDQYSVLASTIDDAAQTDTSSASRNEMSKETRKSLLEHPRKAMANMVKWLRLRDNYLLSTLVSLLCKILRRLGDFDMEIDRYALDEIEDIGRGGRKNYMVTQQHRADLFKAFEENQGVEEIERPPNMARTKQGTIDAWSKSGSATRGTSSSSSLSDDVRSLSKSIDQGRSVLDQMKARQAVKSSALVNSKSASSQAQSLKESRQKAKEEKERRDAKYIAAANALRAPKGPATGEGSGLVGIGIHGKDHGPAPKGSAIMVSSDEESDDDGTEVRTLIGRKTERSKISSEQAQRRALLQPQGPVKKKKIIRSANDMRARIVPNMDNLHLTILRWDIFHEGDEPPNPIECQKVSNAFQTTVNYYNTFYPLLISEAWRSLSTAKEENNFKPFEIKVVNRLSVDRFFEVGTTMQIADNRDNNISEGDIVLLSKAQDPMKERKEMLCLSRVFRVTRKKDVAEISYRISGQAAGSVLTALSPNSKVRGLKITSMTTLEREYAALKSLEFYDLCDEVLSARPSPILAYPDATINPLKAIYGLNSGQARAIWSAKENDAFTLIQG